MTKKHMLMAKAERLYVVEQMTIAEVAQKINVNEKTIRHWKNEGSWEILKSQYVQTKQMFHEDLYNFARKLMISIESDLEDNEKVDPGRMFAFTRVLSMLTKVKEYEDLTLQKDVKKEDIKDISPDIVRLIEAQILGISPNESE